LGTYVPNCIGMLFFMLETCDPQGVTVHVTAPEPTSTGK
jgi:hypothetical protein